MKKSKFKTLFNNFISVNILDFSNSILWLFIFFAIGILFANQNIKLLKTNHCVYILLIISLINIIFYFYKKYLTKHKTYKEKTIFFENISDTIAIISIIVFAFTIGCMRFLIKTQSNKTEIINSKMINIPITATLDNVEFFKNKYQITVKNITSKNLPNKSKMLFNIEIDEYEKNKLKIGDRFNFIAIIHEIHKPIFIKDFNYLKYLSQKNISGLGRITKITKKLNYKSKNSYTDKIYNEIKNIRYNISKYIINTLPTTINGIALAIITGDQNYISKRMQNKYRSAGISHIFAISGFHMGIVASIIFIITRFLLTLIYPLSQKYDVKQFVYPIVIVSLTCYLFLSGLKISSQRAYIMTVLYIIAMMYGKSPISIRLLLYAGFIILMIDPSSITDIGFILSFTSVLALITVFSNKNIQTYIKKTRNKSYLLYFILITFLSSITANIATSIPILYYFGKYPLLSTITNIIIVPIFTIIIVPFLLIFLIINQITDIFNNILIYILNISTNTINNIVKFMTNFKTIYLEVSDFVLITFIIGIIMFSLFKNKSKIIGIITVILSIFLLTLTNYLKLNSDTVIVNKNGDVFTVLNEGQVITFNIIKKYKQNKNYIRNNKISKRFNINNRYIYNIIYHKEINKYHFNDYSIYFSTQNINNEIIPCFHITHLKSSKIINKCLTENDIIEIYFKKSNYTINYSKD